MSVVVFAETVRRHVTSIAFGIFCAFLALVALGVSHFSNPGSVWPSLVAGLAILVGAGPIGPEFSSGALQLVLVKPVSRAGYLLSRVAGVVAVVWAAAVIGFLAELLGRMTAGQGIPWRVMLAILVNTAAGVVLTCALLVLFGSFTRAWFNAAIYVALDLGFMVGLSVLGMIRQTRTDMGAFLTQHLAIERTLIAIQDNLFPEAPRVLDRDWLLLVLSNAAVALLLACLAFRRREVPYGAD